MDAGSDSFTACLEEANPLGAGHDLGQQLGDLSLQRVGVTEDDALLELPGNGPVDLFDAVAEGNRSEGASKIDILIAVTIPNTASPAPYNERRLSIFELRSLRIGRAAAAQIAQ